MKSHKQTAEEAIVIPRRYRPIHAVMDIVFYIASIACVVECGYLILKHI